MSWISITKDTLYEAKMAVVIDLCDRLLLANNQAARAEGLIAGVVGEVRTAVATCPSNAVDADGTKVPFNLRDLTVDMIIARLKTAIEDPLTPDEVSNLAWRRSQLKSIAACELKVDSPDNPVTPAIQGGAAAQLIRPGNDISRCDLNRFF